MNSKDKYDLAIEYLTEHPEEIKFAWVYPNYNHCGCLFQFMVVPRDGRKDGCGCATQIRSLHGSVIINNQIDEQLTDELIEDETIPLDPSDITIESLPHFAKWQRRLGEIEVDSCYDTFLKFKV